MFHPHLHQGLMTTSLFALNKVNCGLNGWNVTNRVNISYQKEDAYFFSCHSNMSLTGGICLLEQSFKYFQFLPLPFSVITRVHVLLTTIQNNKSLKSSLVTANSS